MVRFRDTDPRPRDVSPAFERQRQERSDAEAERQRQGFIDAIERARATKPPAPEGYAELVDRANRIAAERYPIDEETGRFFPAANRRAFVAGYVEAALTGATLRP